jgi:hypothetical protein
MPLTKPTISGIIFSQLVLILKAAIIGLRWRENQPVFLGFRESHHKKEEANDNKGKESIW